MKKLILFIILAAFSLLSSYTAAGTPPIIVGKNLATCPKATFSAIQPAINAAQPGSVVEVCPGVYHEVLLITKPLTLSFNSGAVLMPFNVQATAVSLASGAPLAPIVFVHSTENVHLERLVVDAGAAAIGGCSPNLIGVMYQNASGEVKRSVVRKTKLSPALDGCQSGNGIFVQSGNGGTSNVLVDENQVSDFQKTGIIANEVGTDVQVFDNTVTGVGPTDGAAENGVQIGFGAAATISQNFVSHDIWSPCVSLTDCTSFSTGILVEQSDNIVIEDNYVGANQVNILVNGDNASVHGNRVYGVNVLDGIQVLGNGALIQHNRVVDSSDAALSVSGNNVTASENTFINAPIGILVSSTSTGFVHTGNQFNDIDKNIVDPAPPLLKAKYVTFR